MSLQIEIKGIYGGNLWKNSRFNLVNLVFRNLNTIFAMSNLIM